MRKIFQTSSYDKDTFESMTLLVIKDEFGMNLMFKDKTEGDFDPRSKYTKEEQERIELCNGQLFKNNQPEMTSEEVEYFINIMFPRDPQTEEEIQRLSGFKVKKEIIYFDDLAPKAEV